MLTLGTTRPSSVETCRADFCDASCWSYSCYCCCCCYGSSFIFSPQKYSLHLYSSLVPFNSFANETERQTYKMIAQFRRERRKQAKMVVPKWMGGDNRPCGLLRRPTAMSQNIRYSIFARDPVILLLLRPFRYRRIVQSCPRRLPPSTSESMWGHYYYYVRSNWRQLRNNGPNATYGRRTQNTHTQIRLIHRLHGIMLLLLHKE